MHSTLKFVAGIALSAAASTCAYAAGFAIIEQSVKGLGGAFSNTAAPGDASAMFFNPAALGALEGTEAMAAAHLIVPSSSFTDSGSFVTPTLTGGLPVAGSLTATGIASDGEAGVAGVIPNLYIHHQVQQVLDGRLHLGLGVNAPFALKTDYDDGWVGRYHALTSSVRTTNINPSFAFELTPSFTIGAGFSAQHIEARLTNAVDQSTTCAGFAAAGVIATTFGPGATCAALGMGTPATIATDAKAEFKDARDWSLGWNVGFMWEPVQNTRVGVHYRSKIAHELQATAVFAGVNPALAGLTAAAPGVTALVTQGAKADVTLPETASLHVYHAFNDRWAGHADVSWTRWSRFASLDVSFADGTRLVQPQRWRNSRRYSGGITYNHDDRLTLRVGAAFDETPVPSATLRSARIPGADRTWVTAGVTYQVNKNISVDAGYAHLFIDDPQIRNTEVNTGHTLVGRYEADVNIFSLQAGYRF